MLSNLAFNNSLHILNDEKILSVSELSSAIKNQIEKIFSSLKLQGEVSGLKRHSSGHIYLSLKDNDAVINAICWRGTKLSFQLEEGMEIVVKGRVTSYPARSQYQFIIEEASIAGEGALLKLLNERKKLFSSMGYFNNKRPLPKFPQLVGIITSKTGAVLQDMRHRLEDRYPFCNVLVWSVNVQGVGAAEQVAAAVRGFNFMTERHPDILIVARGGGSIEDLWPFNEEIVVKAVFESRIPVISAIGHETDTTLIDYAADLRAPTPTAAIELATPVLSEVKTQLSDITFRMSNFMQRIVKEFSSHINSISKCLNSSQFAILGITQKFDDKIERFFVAIENFLQKESLKLKAKKLISPNDFLQRQILKLQSKKLINLENYINLKKQRFEASISAYDRILKNYFSKYSEKITILSNRLEQGSFKKILSKGFCFITDALGKTIETKEKFLDLQGSEFIIHFQDGSFTFER